MTYVGIDLHSNNMVNVALNGNGKMVREAKLPTSRRSLEDFFGTFDGPIRAVVECTSNWYWLSDWCRANGVDLTLAHSKMAGAISYAKVKTDTVDAHTLAELLRADLIPEAYQIKHDRRELRELTRGRLRLIQWRGKLQSALWGQAIKYNVPISGSQWRYLGELQQWLQPQLPPAAGLQAELMIEQIIQLQRQIHRIEEEIEKQVPFEATAERLMAVPGLGKVGAWTIMAEIGDITRFPSAKQFVSYCRLVPGASDSGGSRRHKSGNKDGNKYLRAAFGQAAVSAYTHYKVVKKFYRKIKRRSGRPVARAVVAKELAKGVCAECSA
ncbi:IS110 family transposase [Fodinibius sediminis]|uniref:Transposase n=1 Tax=Fodinibius sediminis TaxID=1214077 RepID=A0A521E635_9BACT|nr:IS110 family transposase [Fodinibius sediminis]SMO79408.1 Transposase [Fodinibius sediminis]